MTLDDLMAVWRAQDASPLVDRTLLHLALRKENEALGNDRRRTAWAMYLMSALVLGLMVFFIATTARTGGRLTLWNVLVPLAGAVAALVFAREMYLTYRAQAAEERGFGESLRDQLARRIAQLEDQLTRRARLEVVSGLTLSISGIAIVYGARRWNGEPVSEHWLLKTLIFLAVIFLTIWFERRATRREVLPRKRRLEALLKELDSD